MTTVVEKALNMVRDAPVLAFDVETNGLDWKTKHVVGWALSDGKEKIYVPTNHTGGGNILDADAFVRELALEMEHRKGAVVGHNLKFDMHMAANEGVYLSTCPLSCTMNNQALIDEHSPGFGLEPTAKYHNVTPKKKDSIGKHIANSFGVPNERHVMGHYHRLPGTDALAVAYAEDDALATWEIYEAQLACIDDQNLTTVQTMENDFLKVLYRMERVGIKIDEEELANTIEQVKNNIKIAKSRLPDGFNPNSGPQTRRFVEQFRTDWPTTPAGNPSFEAKWLKTFPEGKMVVDLRQWLKTLNGFLIPMRDEHMFEGRVHANFNQNKIDEFGTVSGRISCNNPNLLAVTKHDKEQAEVIRKVFVADEGMRMADKDYAQIEPVLFGHYSEDPTLLEGYRANPPRDVHTIVAEMFTVDRHTTGKRMNMGMFTGMQARAFAQHMGLPYGKAKMLWDRWNALFPHVQRFRDTAKSRMMKKGYVRTILGRRARLDHRRFAYKATSRIIQGGNADIIKYKMCQVMRELPQVDMLLSAYDNLLFQYPDDREQPWDDLVTEILEDVQTPPFNLKLPVRVDGNSGRNWAEASL